VQDKRILIVSDDPESGGVIRDVLTEARYAVGLVTFPSLTIERIEIGHPNLLLLDVVLLVLDEWPILDQLWRLPTPPPVIAISAPYSSSESLAILSHHVRGHLTKPITAQSLLHMCQRLLDTPDTPRRAASEERRDETRQTYLGDVTFLTSGGRPLLSGQLLELSKNGARIDTGPFPETSLAAGSAVRLSLRLPPTFQRIEIAALVQWHKGSALGVTFVDLDPQVQLWLDQWLSSGKVDLRARPDSRP
jgi:CheY-like chemotaxis protein